MTTKWDNSRFEELNWHDNYVHGLSFSETEDGLGNLTFDLISNWRLTFLKREKEELSISQSLSAPRNE